MPSHVLLYILLTAAWTVFGVIVAAVQHRDQEHPGEPRVSETAEPPERLETRAA